MKIRTFKNEQKFIEESVHFIKKVCTAKKSTISIALSGGATPGPILRALSNESKLPFGNIEFYQVDERYISPFHPDSNQKMIQENLINHIKNSVKDFHPFDTTIDIKNSLTNYEKIIKKLPNQSFDLVILGIGPDGHFASIFPHSSLITSKGKNKLTGNTQTEQFTVKERLSLGIKPILKSKNILILLKGKDKKPIISTLKGTQAEQKKRLNSAQFPALILKRHKNLQIFYCEN